MTGKRKVGVFCLLAMALVFLTAGPAPEQGGCDCDWGSDSSYESPEPDPCKSLSKSAFDLGLKDGWEKAANAAAEEINNLKNQIAVRDETIKALRAQLEERRQPAESLQTAERVVEESEPELIKVIKVKKGYWVKKHVDEVEGADIRATYMCNGWEWGRLNTTIFPGQSLRICKFSE